MRRARRGSTRSLPRALPPNEIPLAVKLKADLPRVAFADRRIRRRDGVATFELRVFVALMLAGVHRIGTATVSYTIDGGAPVALTGVTESLGDTMIAQGHVRRRGAARGRRVSR